MKRLFSLSRALRFPHPVVALGVFDGVHIGHRTIINAAVKRASRCRGTAIVVTFWPHPQREETLYSLQHRLRIFEQMGVRVCVVVPFTVSLAQMTPESFVARVLVGKLHAAEVFVGKDFRFGRKARGTAGALTRIGSRCGFRVKAFPVVTYRGKKVSSTTIRALIKKGDLALACRLLARPVSVFGTVVKGTSVARALGFPTANVIPHHEVMPPPGIYAVKAVVGTRIIDGVCYIGTRPTFSLQRALRKKISRHVEVHLFGKHPNLYGRQLEVFFVKRLREEKKFSSVALLVRSVNKDIAKARRILSSRNTTIYPHVGPP